MSQVKLDMIWQHEKVLPYILSELKAQVERITPVHSMYLHGSRAKTSIDSWNQLKGKDWDVVMVCNFPIVNTRIWTIDKGYYIDLTITTESILQKMMQYQKYVELYPNNTLI